MDRSKLQRLSKGELIDLVLRLQRPEGTSRTSPELPFTNRTKQRDKAKPGGAKPTNNAGALPLHFGVRQKKVTTGHRAILAANCEADVRTVVMAVPATLILRASLGSRLYRDIEVLSSSTLADLADAIIPAFGFDMDHAYGFYSKLTGRLFDSPRRFELFADADMSDSRSVKHTPVTAAFRKVGSAMTLLYDYGDEWRFRVEVVETAKAQPGAAYPRVVSKFGKAPPQYPDMDDE